LYNYKITYNYNYYTDYIGKYDFKFITKKWLDIELVGVFCINYAVYPWWRVYEILISFLPWGKTIWIRCEQYIARITYWECNWLVGRHTTNLWYILIKEIGDTLQLAIHSVGDLLPSLIPCYVFMQSLWQSSPLRTNNKQLILSSNGMIYNNFSLCFSLRTCI